MKTIDDVSNESSWQTMIQGMKYQCKNIFIKLVEVGPVVQWKCIMYGNLTRAKSIHTTWMVFHGRLATKERLMKIGLLNNNLCVFCRDIKSVEHIFFSCQL